MDDETANLIERFRAEFEVVGDKLRCRETGRLIGPADPDDPVSVQIHRDVVAIARGEPH